jgi:hypothetical protein
LNSSLKTAAAPECECARQEAQNEQLRADHIPWLHLRPARQTPGLSRSRQEQLDEHLHQTLLADRDGAGVFRVWLLADDATAAGIPSDIVAEAVRLMLAGQGFLIAARRPEVEVDVRERLLRAMDLFVAAPGASEEPA